MGTIYSVTKYMPAKTVFLPEESNPIEHPFDLNELGLAGATLLATLNAN